MYGAKATRGRSGPSSEPGGEEIVLTIVAVGGGEDWLQEFLRRERIKADVRSLTQQAFRAEFGRAASSALYVLFNDTIRSAFPVGRVVDGTELSAAVAESPRRQPARVDRRISSTLRRSQAHDL